MAEGYPEPSAGYSEDEDQGIYNISQWDETAGDGGSIYESLGNGNGNGTFEFPAPPDNNTITINSSLGTRIWVQDALACLNGMIKHLKALKDMTGNRDTTFPEIRRWAQPILQKLQYQIRNTPGLSTKTTEESQEGRVSSSVDSLGRCLHLCLDVISNILDRKSFEDLSLEDVEKVLQDEEGNFSQDNGASNIGADSQQENPPPTAEGTPATPPAPQSQEQLAVVVLEPVAPEPSREDYRRVLYSFHSGRTRAGTIPLHMVPLEACDTREELKRVQKAKRARAWRLRKGNELRELQDRDRSQTRRGDDEELA